MWYGNRSRHQDTLLNAELADRNIHVDARSSWAFCKRAMQQHDGSLHLIRVSYDHIARNPVGGRLRHLAKNGRGTK